MFPIAAAAQSDDLFWGGYEEEFQGVTGLGGSDPRVMIASLINIALGFLGLVAFLIILLAGFRWMLSMGNEERAAEARKMLGGGIIGLIIILASFGIAQYVVNAIYSATT